MKKFIPPLILLISCQLYGQETKPYLMRYSDVKNDKTIELNFIYAEKVSVKFHKKPVVIIQGQIVYYTDKGESFSGKYAIRIKERSDAHVFEEGFSGKSFNTVIAEGKSDISGKKFGNLVSGTSLEVWLPEGQAFNINCTLADLEIVNYVKGSAIISSINSVAMTIDAAKDDGLSFNLSTSFGYLKIPQKYLSDPYKRSVSFKTKDNPQNYISINTTLGDISLTFNN
jgi:hypothetical protein